MDGGISKTSKKIKNGSMKKSKNKKTKLKNGIAKVALYTESVSIKKKGITGNGIHSSQTTSKTSIPVKTVSISTTSLSFMKFLSNVQKEEDSKVIGEKIFSYIIAPHSVSDFFKNTWEKNHLLIKRKSPKYFNSLFSAQVFDKILRDQHVEFTKNLDITSYSDGERQTHNPVGRAYPSVVWDYFNNGCSVRMLNPQTFYTPVWQMLSGLQDYFGSFCGANVYLTPSDTQGFAPHWDDIEAFVIQLEGKKRWRVYKPRNKMENLPRYSSANLSQNEIGVPIIDVVLEAGDLLYFPRGFIHQAEAVEGDHSLHITLSTYQKNSWADLIEKVISPSCLSSAASKSLALRKGLPLGCLNYMGKMASNKVQNSNDLRKVFKEDMAAIIMKNLLTDDTIDKAVDEMARQFIRVSLPPHMSTEEKVCSVQDDGERWGTEGIKGRVEIEPDTEVRLMRANTCRVVKDPSDSATEYRVYHNMLNSREYEGREEQYLFIEDKYLPAMEKLIQNYPKYTVVEELPMKHLDDKITFVMSLWEQSILRTSHPLNCVDDDDDDGIIVEEI